MNFPGGSVVKNLPAKQEMCVQSLVQDGKGNGNPFQYSCLEKSHEQRSLEGYRPWSCKELDMTL